MTELVGTVAPPVGRSNAQLTDTVRRACPYRSQFLVANARRMSYIDEGSSAGVLARQRHHIAVDLTSGASHVDPPRFNVRGELPTRRLGARPRVVPTQECIVAPRTRVGWERSLRLD